MAKEFEINLFAEESYVRDLEKLKSNLEDLKKSFDKSQKGFQSSFDAQALQRLKQTLNDIRSYEERIIRVQTENIKNLETSTRQRKKYRESLEKEIELLREQRKYQDEILNKIQQIRRGGNVNPNHLTGAFFGENISAHTYKSLSTGDDLNSKLPRMLQLLMGKKAQLSQILGHETQFKKLDEIVKSQTKADSERNRLTATFKQKDVAPSVDETMMGASKRFDDLIKFQKSQGKELRELINKEKGTNKVNQAVTQRDIQFFKEKLATQQRLTADILSEEKQQKYKELRETPGWEALTEEQKRKAKDNIDAQFEERGQALNREFLRRRDLLENGAQYVNEGASFGGSGMAALGSKLGIWGLAIAGGLKLAGAIKDFATEGWQLAVERQEARYQFHAMTKDKYGDYFWNDYRKDYEAKLDEERKQKAKVEALNTSLYQQYWKNHPYENSTSTMRSASTWGFSSGSGYGHSDFVSNAQNDAITDMDLAKYQQESEVWKVEKAKLDKLTAERQEIERSFNSSKTTILSNLKAFENYGINGTEALERSFQVAWQQPRIVNPGNEALRLAKIERLGFDLGSVQQLAKYSSSGETLSASQLWHAINNTFLKASDTYAMMNKYIPMVQQLQNSFFSNRTYRTGIESIDAISILKGFQEAFKDIPGTVFGDERASSAILSVDSALKSQKNDFIESLRFTSNEEAWNTYMRDLEDIYSGKASKETINKIVPIQQILEQLKTEFGSDFTYVHNEQLNKLGTSNFRGFENFINKLNEYGNFGSYEVLNQLFNGDPNLVMPFLVKALGGNFNVKRDSISVEDNVSEAWMVTPAKKTLAKWENAKEATGEPIMDLTDSILTALQPTINAINVLIEELRKTL